MSKMRLTDHKKSYSAPMSKMEARVSKYVKTAFVHSDEATKRVIAPYVTARRDKEATVLKDDRGYFSYYLQRKPSFLPQNFQQFMTEINLPTLLRETGEVLKSITNATGVRCYLVDEIAGELYFDSVVTTRHRVNWKIGLDSTVAAYVAFMKEHVMIEDLISDKRFPEGLGYKDETVKSVLCVPICTPEQECMALMELFRDNRMDGFTVDNLKISVVVCGWMGAAIHQNRERLALQKQQQLNDYLLNLTKCYFADAVILDDMINEVVSFAKVTLGAERGAFYIIDKDKRDELVADCFDEGFDDGKLHRKNIKVKLGKDKGIASIVAKTGVTINIKDAEIDPRFNKEYDSKIGTIVRTTICMPILGLEGVLGVIQLINKKTGVSFTHDDENLLKTFTVYCGLALQYSTVHDRWKLSERHYGVSLRMLKYHIQACKHDKENFHLQSCDIPNELEKFEWYINKDNMTFMPHIAVYMISMITGLEDTEEQKLQNFVLSVRNAYKNNGYHNWDHAFNVTHCMYNILLRNEDMFTDIERKALIVACIIHDVDHGGYTNNFLILTNDVLAQLYEESTLESHHSYVGNIIFDENDFFPNMDSNTRQTLKKEMHEAIIATDLAQYFRRRVKLIQIWQDAQFDWNNQLHRGLVKSVMMTVCDLSGNCKPFHVAKELSDGLYVEFYNQGDIEKKMGLVPLSMMDRDKFANIPEDQVQFLTVVVIPCTDLIRMILPHSEDLYNEACRLRESWKELIMLRGSKVWRQDDSTVHSTT